MNTLDDSELRRRVLEELDWDPSVTASGIAVAVSGGVVTLAGTVPNYAEKRNAERAAKSVFGVKAVAEDLAVSLPGAAERTDPELARAVVSSLSFNVAVPTDAVQATVEDGWVTLDGEVDWQFQSDAAAAAVKHLIGLKGLTNKIRVKPRVTPTDVQSKIRSAFVRRALADSSHIEVDSTDSKVVLRGSVHSWHAKEQAEQAAWSTPGVSKVQNDLIVNPW